MQRSELRFMFEYGETNSCVWNDDGLFPQECLMLSKELDESLKALCKEFQSSLDWEYPPDPSPWTDDHWDDFKARSSEAFHELKNQISDEYELIDVNFFN